MEIINSIIAFCAIAGAVFAGISLRIAVKFRKEDKESKKAYLCPTDEPGFVRPVGSTMEDPLIELHFQNYGQNPASKISSKMLSFNKLDIDGKNEIQEPIMIVLGNCFNPIPFNGKYKLSGYMRELPADKIDISQSHYIIFQIKYLDKILNRNYNDLFYWEIDHEGKLIEVQPEVYDKLKKLANDELSKDKHS